ncbi:MAG: polysaccharide biosynthesis protein [Alphaproteobacteria bacterium]|nr:polysaccharide biosynthesis protein [Alphaproteobacteria bacterium]
MPGPFQISRARVAFFHDVVMAAASFPLSLYLRVGPDFEYFAEAFLWEGLAIITITAAIVFSLSGMYRGIWRYASTNDLIAIAKSVSLVIVLFLLALFLFTRLEDMPRSLPIINWFVLLMLLGGPRFLYRVFKDKRLDHVLEGEQSARTPVLLIGAGDEAEMFIREQARDRGAPYKIVGIIDEKGTRVGREIHGIAVLGSLDDVRSIIQKTAPRRLILTKERLPGGDVRNLLSLADETGVSLARLPRLAELKESRSPDGKAGVTADIRPIAVEDVLGRPQTLLDRDAMAALVRGKRVLVTGAGGTIGGELVRQIAAFKPARIALLDNAEYHLYQIDMDLSVNYPELDRVAILGDVRDRARIDDVMTRESPELVFHAAAYKHVPMVEDNPNEGVLTNVIGTRNVADASQKAGVPLMVQISTDKAVDPANVMGATKRLAESYCQAIDLNTENANGDISSGDMSNNTRIVVVRFGNVLGSTGSVIPLFQKQIAAGGPLTVTHPDMTRFFMTVREAVELVLQASALGVEDADASGKIHVLDMGEPVKVMDLARQMIRLAGLVPDTDIEIKIIGIRPGEKLHERLLHDSESQMPTACEGLMLAAPRTADSAVLRRIIDELETSARARNGDQTLALLHRAVPEFRPVELDNQIAAQ